MRNRSALFAAALVALALGCGKKSDSGSGTGTGATPPPPPPPAERLSAGKQPTMPPLAASTDPLNDAKIALGHALFFDKRLSFDGSRSCYSCHLNENGLGGATPLAIGAGEKPLPRHSPALWNVGYLDGGFYWDGRSDSLEAQAKAAWAGGNLGVGEDKLAAKTAELAKIPGYQALWKAAFGDAPATPEHVTAALAAYERTILCTDTPYDKFAAGDKTALTEGQQRGLDVFLGKAQCSACHTPPHFTIAQQAKGGVYWNAGVGFAGKDPAAVDIGRKKVTGKDSDLGAFKVPTLRGIVKSAPYFHDGSAATLADAVKYMATGGTPNPTLSPLFNDKKLTDAELADLVDFVGPGLACGGALVEPKLP